MYIVAGTFIILTVFFLVAQILVIFVLHLQQHILQVLDRLAEGGVLLSVRALDGVHFVVAVVVVKDTVHADQYFLFFAECLVFLLVF